MAATRNERLSRRHYFPDSSPGGRASFLFLSQGDSSVQLPLPLGGTSVQSHLPQVLGFPMGEPPLQVSLHGALQASIPWRGVLIPGSLAMGLGGPATYHLRGSLFPGPLSRPIPLVSIPSPPFTRSLVPKTPQRTASIILGAPLMPGIPSPERNLCTLASPTEALP